MCEDGLLRVFRAQAWWRGSGACGCVLGLDRLCITGNTEDGLDPGHAWLGTTCVFSVDRWLLTLSMEDPNLWDLTTFVVIVGFALRLSPATLGDPQNPWLTVGSQIGSSGMAFTTR